MKDEHPSAQTPLAIVGIACLYPKAEDLKAYWSNIKERVDGITEVPASHWDLQEYFDADPKSPDRTYGRRGGFLSPVDFDPTEFGISPNNIPATDPAQLLGLVVAQAAMRDAGYGPERDFDRRRVSVVLGVTGTLELAIPLGARLGHPIWRKALREAGIAGERAEAVIRRISDHYVEWQENSFPGLLGNVVAGRIANRLDLGGTNCVVDAACASSLSAAHLASLELAAGRSDMVVTGGVDSFNDIFMYMCFSKTPALSPTGDSRPFDAKGDGTILGEGVGMVVLKRQSDAERDGDSVYAVLKGIGSSSDGRGKAIYAPSAEGQVQALSNAYRCSGVSPDTVELVEAHGTGTKVGDAAELQALAEVYRSSGRPGTWCALGSVKSNLGHTKAAAGAAGLIKAALALKHKVLPPTIKVSEPLPGLAGGETPFYLNTEKRPWLPPAGHPRRAAVSAFGFGGSNFHAVLEEHRPAKAGTDWDSTVELAAFSAPDLEALLESLAAWASPMTWEEVRLKAYASRSAPAAGLSAAGIAREEHGPRAAFDRRQPLRLCVVLEKGKTDTVKLFTELGETARKNREKRFWSTREGSYFFSGAPLGRLAALFPGQGAQYVGMGRDLACQFSAMQEALAQADAALGEPLSELIYPRPVFTAEAAAQAEASLRATQAAQPAIGAVSLGALRVLGIFGVMPESCGGHSYGELSALCAAGRLTAEELFTLSRLRGRLMASGGGDKGTMLAALAPIERVRSAVEEEKLDVVLANKNAPEQVVLSGGTEDIRRAAKVLESRGIRVSPLSVAAAFHSRLVADAAKPLREALETAAFPAGAVPVYSNTTAQPYPADKKKSKDLLAGQLASPVEFLSQVENMYRDGARIFLEIGPGARLTGLVKSILGEREHLALALDSSSGKRHGTADLARALAQLAAAGLAVDLTPWEGGEEGVRALLARPKPKVVVRISGATPLNPKSKSAPLPPLPPPAGAEAAQALEGPVPRPIGMGVGEAAPVPPGPAARAENGPRMADPCHAGLPAVPPAEALRLSQEGILALQKLQEQASNLHRRYLEGQESAQRSLLGLIEHQNRLLLGGDSTVSAQSSSAELAALLIQAAPAAPQEEKAPEPALEPGIDSSRVRSVLLGVVSEKTGYPEETLNLDMGLESDLGIDSIKRVEILAAMREKLPEAPAVGPQHVGALRTLRQIIEFLCASPAADGQRSPEGGRPPLPEAAAVPPAAKTGLDSSRVRSVLLGVVSEKTGYPEETLNLDMGLESDLGIDSIKRVEILAAMREKLPEAPAVGPQHVGALRTLRQIIDFLSASPSEALSAVPAAEGERSPEGAAPVAPKGESAPDGKRGIERSVLHCVPFLDSRRSAPLPAGSEVWVTDDGSALAREALSGLKARGFKPEAVKLEGRRPELPERLGALILLAPASRLGSSGIWSRESEEWVKSAFQLAREAAPALRRGAPSSLLTVSRLDGAFGLEGPEDADPVFGALAGLAKTARAEWPEVRCRALDLGPGADIGRLWAELDFAGPAELGISESGLRTLELRPAAAQPGGRLLGESDAVLITGGARGVTAEAAAALARATGAPIALLGRTPPPGEEPEWLKGLSDESAIKKAILRSTPGARLSPKEIEAAYRRHAAGREVRATLRRVEEAGSKALYLSADIRDAASVRAAVERVRRELGPIRALVHGAGVLADKSIEDKAPELFGPVFDTKVAGLRHLLSCLDLGELKALALFSSVSARVGRAGQSDYAMANEALNKAAQSLARRLRDCRVVSINWGPWEGGMVTPSLRRVFEGEGVALLPLREGGEHFVAELGASGVEALVQAPAPAGAAAPPRSGERGPLALETVFERELDPRTHPFLSSHVINGHAVLPAAMMFEWFAHAALHGNPGLVFCGLDGFRITRGVILKDGPRSVRVCAGRAEREGESWRVRVELRVLEGPAPRSIGMGVGEAAQAPEGLCALAEAVLCARAPAPGPVRRFPEGAAYGREVGEAYRDLLFHGPLLRGIEAVEGCSAEGISVKLAAAPAPGAWMQKPVRSSWLAEPLAIDAAFQAVILWSWERNGAACLPNSVRRYRQFRTQFPKQGLRALVSAESRGGSSAAADVDFVDGRGELVARIEGSEHTVDASLKDAFRKSAAAA